MKQKGQIEIIVVFLLMIGAIFFSQWIEKKELAQKGLKKEATISSSILKNEGGSSKEKIVTKKEIENEEVEEEIDKVPPKRFNPQPTGKLLPEIKKTEISLTTDEKATCRYGLVEGLSFDSMNRFFSNTNATSHSTLIATLSEGEKYNFYVKCVDLFGNKNTDDFKISFEVKVPEDKTPPIRRNLWPSGILPATTTQVEISLSTDEKATCHYSTSSGKSYWQMEGSFSSNQYGTFHWAKIYKLTFGKVYDYFVRCRDSSGNYNDGDVMIRFGIGVSP